MAETHLELGSATDVGQRRDHNEDAFVTFETEDGATVLVVADGMGGHLAGEVASAMAIETLQRELTHPATDPSGTLKAAIELANKEIWEEADRDSEKAGMGSTIVVAIVVGNQVFMANAGDSPAYLVRDGQAVQITRDHGLVAEQVEAGLIRAEDADHHPFRHILTRCLGAESAVDVEVYPPRELQAGDLLVLASDGLTEHVNKRELGDLIPHSTTQEIAHSLVNVANQRGGHDNITVVAARFGEGEESATVAYDLDEVYLDEGEAVTTQMAIPPLDPAPPKGE